jgi:hypothetical protein
MGTHGAFRARGDSKRYRRKIIMNNSLSLFEMLTLLCALAWRQRVAGGPERTSSPATLPTGFHESSIFSKKRNLQFASRGAEASRRN